MLLYDKHTVGAIASVIERLWTFIALADLPRHNGADVLSRIKGKQTRLIWLVIIFKFHFLCHQSSYRCINALGTHCVQASQRACIIQGYISQRFFELNGAEEYSSHVRAAE